MIILDRYIMDNYAKGIAPVLLFLLSLFSLLMLIEELPNAGKGTFSQLDAFLIVFYSLPTLLVGLLPATALIGGLMGLGAMANHHEFIVARSAGMSRARIARPVFLVSFILAVILVLIQSLLIPVSQRKASELRFKSLETASFAVGDQLEFWTKVNGYFVHVNKVMFNRVLSGVEIYELDNHGRLKLLITADSATIVEKETWLLKDTVQTQLKNSSRSEKLQSTLEWTGLLSQEMTDTLLQPIEEVPPYELLRYIRHLETNQLDTHQLRIVFWKQVSLAFSVIALGLLSLPMLTGLTRAIPASQRILIGGIVGIAIYMLQQLTSHLAILFGWLPFVTVMLPVLLLLAGAVLTQFWHGFNPEEH